MSGDNEVYAREPLSSLAERGYPRGVRWLRFKVLVAATLVVTAAYAQTNVNADLKAKIDDAARRQVKIGTAPNPAEMYERYQDHSAQWSRAKISTFYEQRYEHYKGKQGFDWKNWGGWLAFGGLVLVLVLRRALETLVQQVVSALWRPAFRALRGFRTFRRYAVKRYRRAVDRRFSQVPLTFGQKNKIDLRQLYVSLEPVRLDEKAEVARKKYSFRKELASNRRLTVVGPPGSGKSTLLKHVMLAWADGTWKLPGDAMPIYLELGTMSGSDESIERHLAGALQDNDFPEGAAFVERGIEQGTVLLLFDGLDEVPSEQRPKIVEKITKILKREKCRAVITCRDAVYDGEFAGEVEQALKILEFSDQQIQEFLGGWKDRFVDTTIEEVMANLADRPRIKKLAKNPLLLTIIALLYTERKFKLPHSRAAFYDKAVDVLLEQHHKEANVYQARDKRRILRSLAVRGMRRAAHRDDRDRRSLSYDEVRNDMAEILEKLHLDPKADGKAIETEIVERSGLLLRLDGGERFQFAHLTLQEFFAAEYYASEREELIAEFIRDPDEWRESVKLWCGLPSTSNSTWVIEEVFRTDPVAAFECLAEANEVDDALAAQIVGRMKTGFEAGERTERILQGFAAVAAASVDGGRIGKEIFQYLCEKLDAEEQDLRIAAVKALAATNLPAAVDVLAPLYTERPEIQNALVRMGDLAVSTLREQATNGSTEAIDLLAEVGTPAAARALVPLLWHDSHEVLITAAWKLAFLLRQYNIEAELRKADLPSNSGDSGILEWIWVPFEEPEGSVLPTIVGRVAWVLQRTHVAFQVSDRALDERIVFGLCFVVLPAPNLCFPDSDLNSEDRAKERGWKECVRGLDLVQKITDAARKPYIQPLQTCLDDIAYIFKASDEWDRFRRNLPLTRQTELIVRLARANGICTKDHWVTMFRPVEFLFSHSWSGAFVGVVISAMMLTMVITVSMEIWNAPSLITVENAGRALAILGAFGIWVLYCWQVFLKGEEDGAPAVVLMLIVGLLWLVLGWAFGAFGIHSYWDLPVWVQFTSGVILIVIIIWAAIEQELDTGFGITILFIIVFFVFDGVRLSYLTTHRWFVRFAGGQLEAFGVWAVLGSIVGFLLWRSIRREALSNNPCAKLFQEKEKESEKQTRWLSLRRWLRFRNTR